MNVYLGHKDNAVIGTSAHEHIISLDNLLESNPSQRLATFLIRFVKSKNLHINNIDLLEGLFFWLLYDLAKRDDIRGNINSTQFQVSKDFTNLII